MKNIIFIILICSTQISCQIPEQKEMTYLGFEYEDSMNASFLNKKLFFFDSADTLTINLKVPYDPIKKEAINYGLYYNCILQKGIKYTIKLEETTSKQIPDNVHSYYVVNAMFLSDSSSQFQELKNDSKREDVYFDGRFVDMGNRLYKIVSFNPKTGCLMQH